MITTYYSKARERELAEVATPRLGSWIVAIEPTEAELQKLATDFDLDLDNLTDAVDLYEAPRIDVDKTAVYLYTRYCWPEGVEIATEPLLVISTKDQLLTVVRTATPILDRLTIPESAVVTTQKTKALLHILGEINASYEQQLGRVSKRILRLRAQMRQSRLSTREFLSIIELEEDLNEFLSALQPQSLLYISLLNGKYMKLYEQDRDIIEDLERSTGELIEQLRGRLRTLGNMREAYDAIATTNLNSIFKRLTSISIFIAIPNLIISIWSMNVPIPFQHTTYTFYCLMAFTLLVVSSVIFVFKRNRWL